MLPRQGIQQRAKMAARDEEEERENTKALGNRNNIGTGPHNIGNNHKPKVIATVGKPGPLKPQSSPPKPQPQISSQRRNSAIQGVISAVNSANNAVNANISGLGYPRSVNNFVGRQPQ